jgi:hypothetical protein
MLPFDKFLLPDDSFATGRHPLIRSLFRRLVNIALTSLAAFAVVGSAACALRIVFLSH